MSNPPLIQKSYISLPSHSNQQIHYRSAIPASATKPPILLLHKSASSSASYTHLLHHYSALNHPCYAPDFPGFGQSFDPSPSEELTTAWYTAIIRAFVQALNLPPYHVIGHHSGAAVGLELTAVCDEVLSLSLLGPTIMSGAERKIMRDRFVEDIPFNKPDASGSHLAKTWAYCAKMGLAAAISQAGDDEERQKLVSLLHREALDHARAWRGRKSIYTAVFEQDSEELWRRVLRRGVKVLVMCARDDVLWGHFEGWKGLVEVKEEGAVREGEVGGANFGLNLDWKGVCGHVDALLRDVKVGGE